MLGQIIRPSGSQLHFRDTEAANLPLMKKDMLKVIAK